ncbi:Uncharacterised protein [Mycobacteroides abscessus subsp. abscessus]|nr:Uncharacterised protein [Mycobacteroides abscessus subsp. abscessus]
MPLYMKMFSSMFAGIFEAGRTRQVFGMRQDLLQKESLLIGWKSTYCLKKSKYILPLSYLKMCSAAGIAGPYCFLEFAASGARMT